MSFEEAVSAIDEHERCSHLALSSRSAGGSCRQPVELQQGAAMTRNWLSAGAAIQNRRTWRVMSGLKAWRYDSRNGPVPS
jgi:hypothetical protein